MTKTVSIFLSALAAAVLLGGCQTVHVVPVAQRTPAFCGNVKLYGTDNVPFEYEELGIVSVSLSHATTDEVLQLFVSEVQKLGADAALNVRFQSVNRTGGFFLVLTLPNDNLITGTAVKKTRP